MMRRSLNEEYYRILMKKAQDRAVELKRKYSGMESELAAQKMIVEQFKAVVDIGIKSTETLHQALTDAIKIIDSIHGPQEHKWLKENADLVKYLKKKEAANGRKRAPGV